MNRRIGGDEVGTTVPIGIVVDDDGIVVVVVGVVDACGSETNVSGGIKGGMMRCALTVPGAGAGGINAPLGLISPPRLVPSISLLMTSWMGGGGGCKCGGIMRGSTGISGYVCCRPLLLLLILLLALLLPRSTAETVTGPGRSW